MKSGDCFEQHAAAEAPPTLFDLEPQLERIERAAAGANSRVYKLTLHAGSEYIIKHYFRNDDQRQRLEREYAALSFLWRHGIHTVPEPLGVDYAARCALYGCLPGVRKPDAEFTAADAGQFVALIRSVNEVRAAADAAELPAAAEACFSLRALTQSVGARLARVDAAAPEHPQLEAFLKGPFCALRHEALSASPAQSSELPAHCRILSPSDVGTHNALYGPDGVWRFFDFEYFGWDDPAKLICDFLLHPGMQIERELRLVFARGVLAVCADPELPRRVALQYPLWALKWCAIILNEFLPEHRRRRSFAASEPVNWREIEERQLTKAERILDIVRHTHGRLHNDLQAGADTARP